MTETFEEELERKAKELDQWRYVRHELLRLGAMGTPTVTERIKMRLKREKTYSFRELQVIVRNALKAPKPEEGGTWLPTDLPNKYISLILKLRSKGIQF